MSDSYIKGMLGIPNHYWCCYNRRHKSIKWNDEGTQAKCLECGEESPVFSDRQNKYESKKNGEGKC
jgi:hypothetical protein